MELGVFIMGVLFLVMGVKAKDTGAGLPLIVGGACLALFGAVWFLAVHFSAYGD
jgi:hypothetical protein